MRSSRGFTLIELLVVIAIIGVLSSIVLSSLNTARNRGNDATIKSDLDQVRTQAELFYDANGNHYVVTPGGSTDFCSLSASVGGLKGGYPNLLNAAQAAGLTTVNSTIGTAGNTGTVTCHACFAGEASTNCTTSDRWAAESPLKSITGTTYCVDSTGFTGTTTATLGSGDAICN